MIRKIQIGPLTFDVYYQDGWVADEGNLGYCCVTSNEIVISKSQNVHSTHSILLHEVIEAFNSLYEVKLNHHQINLLEKLFYDFITNNPEAIQQIQETI